MIEELCLEPDLVFHLRVELELRYYNLFCRNKNGGSS